MLSNRMLLRFAAAMKLRRAPDFWWQSHSPAGLALAPLGAIYGAFAGRRMERAGDLVGAPVICIGNFVIGGAGKTPTALEVANVCRKLGLTPGFLTRGYRGRETGPLLVSRTAHSPRDVGDEAHLLAQSAPTVVAADRPAGAKLLVSFGANVIVMDDGFQNPSLHKDLSLVVLDAGRGIGNGRVFPAGPLRAPLSRQARLADAILVLGAGTGGKGVRMAARAGRPILHGHTESVRRRGLKRRPYLAYAGIADPRKFYTALAATGATIGHTMDFPDHHLFTHVDCEAILAEAKSRGLVPITTEKDRVRLNRSGDAAERLAAATEVFPVRIRFEEPRRLIALIEDAVGAYGSAYSRQLQLAGRSDSSRWSEASASA
jgi:tetraacyldisaccharide 4'-kinase